MIPAWWSAGWQLVAQDDGDDGLDEIGFGDDRNDSETPDHTPHCVPSAAQWHGRGSRMLTTKGRCDKFGGRFHWAENHVRRRMEPPQAQDIEQAASLCKLYLVVDQGGSMVACELTDSGVDVTLTNPPATIGVLIINRMTMLGTPNSMVIAS
ncbi:MAG: hypothetical protein ACI9OJ_001688 [Myxococcota bacterium]|jgi:hypothetical protein